MNKDNSHSWVKISHGLNKLVTNLNDKEYDENEQETSETKMEVLALKTEVLAYASRSKAKAKTRRRPSARFFGRWQEAEATRKGFNIVLTRQDKKFLVSELFKVTQDAIPLILHSRTMG